MQKNSTSHLNEQELKDTAEIAEIPIRLMMHGVPRDMVEHATMDQIRVLWQIYLEDLKTQQMFNRSAVNQGVNASLGGDVND